MPRLRFRQLAFLITVTIASTCFMGSYLLTDSSAKLRDVNHLNDPNILEKRKDDFYEQRQLSLRAFLSDVVASNGTSDRHLNILAGEHNVEWNETHVVQIRLDFLKTPVGGAMRTETPVKSLTVYSDNKLDNTFVGMRDDSRVTILRVNADGNVTTTASNKAENTSTLTDLEESSGSHPKNCTPGRSVAMIKTHKCSSSTLQNILLRKAEDLNLTIAVPRSNVYFGNNYFMRGFIRGDRHETRYNIMASHMRFRRMEDVRGVMVSDAKFITILREPSRQFESVYSYCQWASIYGVDLETFVENPERYFRNIKLKSLVAGRNPMCYDNGLDARYLKPSDPRVDSFIANMSKWHDLVLIAEHFEESLVLLKELMCWTLDDVVFLSQNMRSKELVTDLSPENRTAIRKWNWADTLLYDHFNATLWRRIDAFGTSRMGKEVAELRRKNGALAEDCIDEVVTIGDKRMWYPPGMEIKSFLLNKNATKQHLCEQLTRPELTYLNFFRKRIPLNGYSIHSRNRTRTYNTIQKDALMKYLAKTANKPMARPNTIMGDRDKARVAGKPEAKANNGIVQKRPELMLFRKGSIKRQGNPISPKDHHLLKRVL